MIEKDKPRIWFFRATGGSERFGGGWRGGASLY